MLDTAKLEADGYYWSLSKTQVTGNKYCLTIWKDAVKPTFAANGKLRLWRVCKSFYGSSIDEVLSNCYGALYQTR